MISNLVSSESRKIFRIVLVALTLSMLAISSYAQSAKKPRSKQLLSEIIAKKNPSSRFVLLKPSELAQLGDFASGDPCNTATPIGFTQQIDAALTSTDCQLDDLSFADFYIFDGVQGEQAIIRLSSGDFDTYLGLANETGTWVLEDDDGGGGTNSFISTTLPETGNYIIIANSYDPNEFGLYFLSLDGGPQCAFTFSPESANVPQVGGTFSFSVTTQPRCYWQSYTGAFFVTPVGSGMGSGTVSYTVDANTTVFPRQGSVWLRNYQFNIFQPGIPCNFAVNPTSVNVPATQTTGSFSVTATAGCPWMASSTDIVSVNGSGTGNGNGTVNYTVHNNNGAARVGRIFVGDTWLTINQAGLNCTFSSPSRRTNIVSRHGKSGTIGVDTQTNCAWQAVSNASFLRLQNSAGFGPLEIPYTFDPISAPGDRSAAISISMNLGETTEWITFWFDQYWNFATYTTEFDFDYDRQTDLSIFRPSLGQWWINRSSSNQAVAFEFGNSFDKPAPADFTGDGFTDIAFWRPSTGQWFVLRSEDLTFYAFPFGSNGDIAVPADYDADFKADAAVFRPASATWFILKSTGGVAIETFGANTDLPVPADYDGDGMADIAIYRPNGESKEWWYKRSSNGTYYAATFGATGDRAVPGDYTGDGKSDIAFFRPSNGNWYVLKSEDSNYYAFPFGTNGDVPAPGDYDRDGKFDATIFRPATSTWYSLRSAAGVMIQQFGSAGDQPLPGVFVR